MKHSEKKMFAVAHVLFSGQLVPSVQFPFKAFAMDINSLTLIITQTLLINSSSQKPFGYQMLREVNGTQYFQA